jgi:hypothetical protein
MVTPGDLPPQQQADVDDPSKHLEEHVSSAAHLKASQAADIEAAVRQDLASELGGEYVQPLEVLNLLQVRRHQSVHTYSALGAAVHSCTLRQQHCSGAALSPAASLHSETAPAHHQHCLPAPAPCSWCS